jgi:hypothetical protein
MLLKHAGGNYTFQARWLLYLPQGLMLKILRYQHISFKFFERTSEQRTITSLHRIA